MIQSIWTMVWELLGYAEELLKVSGVPEGEHRQMTALGEARVKRLDGSVVIETDDIRVAINKTKPKSTSDGKKYVLF